MMLNNVINSIIYYTEELLKLYWKKIVFVEIAALHRYQLGLRPKPLVTTRDFNNLCCKNVALSPLAFNNIKNMKFFAGAFQEFLQRISKHLLSRTPFVDCFRYKERITER